MKKVSAAIVGCGRVSRFHASAYLKLSQTKLIAGVDIDPERRNWFENVFHLPTYRSLSDLLSKNPPDLISLCTPSDLHFSQAKEIMKAGVNVIIEKPVCLQESEGQELLKLEQKSGVIVSTCFQNRFNPAVNELLKSVESKKLGKILVGNVCVRWFRRPDYYINHWHGSKYRSGGGALMTQAIHHIDLLRLLMGLPKEINGYSFYLRSYSEVEDIVVAYLKYSSSIASIECSTIAYPKDIEASITIIAENGTIKIGGKSLNKVEYGFAGDNCLAEVVDSEDPDTVYGTSHILLIKDVANAIIRKKLPKVSLSEGVKSLNLVNEIYRSLNKESNSNFDLHG